MEVCAVTSAVPVSGQTISVQVSTQDDSATGKHNDILLSYLLDTTLIAEINLILWLCLHIKYYNIYILSSAGSDYSPLVAVVLTFTSASSQRQCVDISILDDNLAEPIEQFFVQLTQTATQQTDQAVVIVTDNDGKCIPVHVCNNYNSYV